METTLMPILALGSFEEGSYAAVSRYSRIVYGFFFAPASAR